MTFIPAACELAFVMDVSETILLMKVVDEDTMWLRLERPTRAQTKDCIVSFNCGMARFVQETDGAR